jgi:hypothetical protein
MATPARALSSPTDTSGKKPAHRVPLNSRWATHGRGFGYPRHNPSPISQFEKFALSLGLNSDIEMECSEPLKRWAKLHRNTHYVPEWLLTAWGLQVRPDAGEW